MAGQKADYGMVLKFLANNDVPSANSITMDSRRLILMGSQLENMNLELNKNLAVINEMSQTASAEWTGPTATLFIDRLSKLSMRLGALVTGNEETVEVLNKILKDYGAATDRLNDALRPLQGG